MEQEEKRKYDREWYKKQTKKWKQKKISAQYQRRKEKKFFVDAYKKERGCSCNNCTENEPCCLDFHHEGDDKEACIANMVRNSCSVVNIMKEIEKCTILCANCHRKFHAGINFE